jgi:putative CocE/NonD family hydrolase
MPIGIRVTAVQASAAFNGLLLAVCVASFSACGGGSSGSDGAGSATNGGSSGASSQWTVLGTRGASGRPNTAIAGNPNAAWVDYDAPATYAGIVTEQNIWLPMDDGVGISLTVTRPAGGDGLPVAEPLPTLVTFTPYNKNVGDTIPLGGAVNEYFVRRGYNQVFVDVRGTGRSGGSWDPFSAREQQDYPQVLDWVVQQPWSNGVIGMWGISATATTALLAAGQGHPAIRAVFPIVPMGDVYRDVVFVGGQASIAFLPAWMTVVVLAATLNPTFYDQPDQYLAAVAGHLAGANDFIVPRTVGVLAGQADTAYDNAYWGTKSPVENSTGVRVPTFIVGGLYDIFQRSEPLNYEGLKNHTTAKLLIGPWHHLQAAVGEGLPREGVPPLDHIALMWFDRYLKGMPNGAENLPNVTQWVWGHEHFVTSADWPHPQARAGRYFLQGGGSLDLAPPPAGGAPSMVLQQPFNGICSESSLQISLGLLGNLPLPCWYEDNLAQALEASFDTAPLEEDLYINGPIQADIWMSTTAANAGLVVRVSDLESDGTARALAFGVQTASLRAVDESKSRYLDGEMIQPWHPFTAESEETVGSGNIVKVPVEVFQTSALIRRGHRLRISVGASNFPFGMMPVPALAQSIVGVMSIYSDSAHPSSVVLPVVPAAQLQ